MLHQAAGFALALLSMVLYSLYMVPRKRTPVSQATFTFWMGWGILIGTAAIGIAAGGLKSISSTQYALVFISGVVWATGSDAYCRAVRYIGLSRSTPIKNISAFLGTLFGIVVFHEFSPRNGLPLTMVILGSLAVVLSAALLGRVEANGSDEVKTGKRRLFLGIACSIWAAIAYSVYTVPMKIAYSHGVSPSEFLFYMGQGCFVGMTLLALLAGAKPAPLGVTWRDRGLAQLAGLMWAVGSLFANIAVKHIGVAVTWPLTKNTVVAVAYGVLVLKEVNVAKHRRNLMGGLVLSIIGVTLLAFAMSKS